VIEGPGSGLEKRLQGGHHGNPDQERPVRAPSPPGRATRWGGRC
jgi:hypothetical protein